MQYFGPRIPTLGFVTGGAGESDEGIPPQPYETFAYDNALRQAKIEDFNIMLYTSVLPPELYGKIVEVDDVTDQFYHGAVLETIMAGCGTDLTEYKSIATGIGIIWVQDNEEKLVGGYAAEYIQLFDAPIDDAIAEVSARMWLDKSLDHELKIRNVQHHGKKEYWHNHLNLTKHYGYCLTAIGFLNFRHAPPVILN